MPHLTYCQLVWHFCKSSDSRKVERVQERALRAVYRNRIDSYENLLERAQLPTLLNRRLQDIAMLMYKVKNDLLPSSVTDIFSIKDSNYSLRNSDFSIPRVNTEKYGTLVALLWTFFVVKVAGRSSDCTYNQVQKFLRLGICCPPPL